MEVLNYLLDHKNMHVIMRNMTFDDLHVIDRYISRINSRILCPISALRIGLRYLVIQTIWYLMSYTV